MSTETGDAKVVADIVAEAKAMLATEREELRQLDMLDPISPEEMLEAREALGPEAGRLAVLRHARQGKRGRPLGARNKRTDDFARWLLSFGQHPAITMMQIQATPPELLIEASKQERVHSFRADGTANVVIERMTYGEAQALRTRCSEGLLPYLESKKPVAVDMNFSGVSDLLIEGLTHSREEIQDIVDADFLQVDDEGAAV